MRLRSHPRAERLLGRLPRPTVYSALELLLLALVAVQAARLFWTVVTPVGPVGDWKGTSATAMPAAGAALAEFDPFFRLSAAGPAVVTSLSLKLYGVRDDRATGRGSAIIALPDGTQQSYAVGDEIMPGVTLSQVGFDSVTISRGGTPEQ
ncbi:MAG TPA: type II secretion system protein N, partial [Allosphingosinicella sp.]|nr:type II secretion system protein N [Allosphingosinicella sp.]